MRSCRGVVAIGLASCALAACSTSPPGSPVASPPADASPEQVVQALVDAVNAGDAELVQDLSAGGSSQFEDWVADDASLRDAEILRLVDDPGQGAGTAYPEAVGVVVSFVPHGTDASLPEGSGVTWTFLLTDDSGRWLVFGAGAG